MSISEAPPLGVLPPHLISHLLTSRIDETLALHASSSSARGAATADLGMPPAPLSARVRTLSPSKQVHGRVKRHLVCIAAPHPSQPHLEMPLTVLPITLDVPLVTAATATSALPTFVEMLLHPQQHPALQSIVKVSEVRAVELAHSTLAQQIYGRTPTVSRTVESLGPQEMMAMRASVFAHPDIQVRLLLFWVLAKPKRSDGLLTYQGYRSVYLRLAKRLLGGKYRQAQAVKNCERDWARDWGGVYPGASEEFSHTQGLPLQAFMQSIFETIDVFLPAPAIQSVPMGVNGIRVPLPNREAYERVMEKLLVEITMKVEKKTDEEIVTQDKSEAVPPPPFTFRYRDLLHVPSSDFNAPSTSEPASSPTKAHHYCIGMIENILQHPGSEFQRARRRDEEAEREREQSSEKIDAAPANQDFSDFDAPTSPFKSPKKALSASAKSEEVASKASSSLPSPNRKASSSEAASRGTAAAATKQMVSIVLPSVTSGAKVLQPRPSISHPASAIILPSATTATSGASTSNPSTRSSRRTSPSPSTRSSSKVSPAQSTRSSRRGSPSQSSMSSRRESPTPSTGKEKSSRLGSPMERGGDEKEEVEDEDEEVGAWNKLEDEDGELELIAANTTQTTAATATYSSTTSGTKTSKKSPSPIIASPSPLESAITSALASPGSSSNVGDASPMKRAKKTVVINEERNTSPSKELSGAGRSSPKKSIVAAIGSRTPKSRSRAASPSGSLKSGRSSPSGRSPSSSPATLPPDEPLPEDHTGALLRNLRSLVEMNKKTVGVSLQSIEKAISQAQSRVNSTTVSPTLSPAMSKRSSIIVVGSEGEHPTLQVKVTDAAAKAVVDSNGEDGGEMMKTPMSEADILPSDDLALVPSPSISDSGASPIAQVLSRDDSSTSKAMSRDASSTRISQSSSRALSRSQSPHSLDESALSDRVDSLFSQISRAHQDGKSAVATVGAMVEQAKVMHASSNMHVEDIPDFLKPVVAEKSSTVSPNRSTRSLALKKTNSKQSSRRPSQMNIELPADLVTTAVTTSADGGKVMKKLKPSAKQNKSMPPLEVGNAPANDNDTPDAILHMMGRAEALRIAAELEAKVDSALTPSSDLPVSHTASSLFSLLSSHSILSSTPERFLPASASQVEDLRAERKASLALELTLRRTRTKAARLAGKQRASEKEEARRQRREEERRAREKMEAELREEKRRAEERRAEENAVKRLAVLTPRIAAAIVTPSGTGRFDFTRVITPNPLHSPGALSRTASLSAQVADTPAPSISKPIKVIPSLDHFELPEVAPVAEENVEDLFAHIETSPDPLFTASTGTTDAASSDARSRTQIISDAEAKRLLKEQQESRRVLEFKRKVERERVRTKKMISPASKSRLLEQKVDVTVETKPAVAQRTSTPSAVKHQAVEAEKSSPHDQTPSPIQIPIDSLAASTASIDKTSIPHSATGLPSSRSSSPLVEDDASEFSSLAPSTPAESEHDVGAGDEGAEETAQSGRESPKEDTALVVQSPASSETIAVLTIIECEKASHPAELAHAAPTAISHNSQAAAPSASKSNSAMATSYLLQHITATTSTSATTDEADPPKEQPQEVLRPSDKANHEEEKLQESLEGESQSFTPWPPAASRTLFSSTSAHIHPYSHLQTWSDLEEALSSAATPMEVLQLQKYMTNLRQHTHGVRGAVLEPSGGVGRIHPKKYTSKFALPSRRLIDHLKKVEPPILRKKTPKRPPHTQTERNDMDEAGLEQSMSDGVGQQEVPLTVSTDNEAGPGQEEKTEASQTAEVEPVAVYSADMLRKFVSGSIPLTTHVHSAPRSPSAQRQAPPLINPRPLRRVASPEKQSALRGSHEIRPPSAPRSPSGFSAIRAPWPLPLKQPKRRHTAKAELEPREALKRSLTVFASKPEVVDPLEGNEAGRSQTARRASGPTLDDTFFPPGSQSSRTSPRAAYRQSSPLSSSLSRSPESRVDLTRISSTALPTYSAPVASSPSSRLGTSSSRANSLRAPGAGKPSLLEEDMFKFAQHLQAHGDVSWLPKALPNVSSGSAVELDQTYSAQMAMSFIRGLPASPFLPPSVLFATESGGPSMLARHLDLVSSARHEVMGSAVRFEPRNSNYAIAATGPEYVQKEKSRVMVRRAIERGDFNDRMQASDSDLFSSHSPRTATSSTYNGSSTHSVTSNAQYFQMDSSMGQAPSNFSHFDSHSTQLVSLPPLAHSHSREEATSMRSSRVPMQPRAKTSHAASRSAVANALTIQAETRRRTAEGNVTAALAATVVPLKA